MFNTLPKKNVPFAVKAEGAVSEPVRITAQRPSRGKFSRVLRKSSLTYIQYAGVAFPRPRKNLLRDSGISRYVDRFSELVKKLNYIVQRRAHGNGVLSVTAEVEIFRARLKRI